MLTRLSSLLACAGAVIAQSSSDSDGAVGSAIAQGIGLAAKDSSASSSTTSSFPSFTSFTNSSTLVTTSATTSNSATFTGIDTITNTDNAAFRSAFSCNQVQAAWTSAAAAWSSNHSSLTSFTTSGTSIYIGEEFGFDVTYTGVNITLCDGKPRAASDTYNVTTVDTFTSTITLTNYSPYPTPAPTCSLGIPACDLLQTAWWSEIYSIQSTSPFDGQPTWNPVCEGSCGECTVGAYNAQLLYWPVTTSPGGIGDYCKNHTTLTPTPTIPGKPNLATYATYTLTSPSVYIILQGIDAMAGDASCGPSISETIISLDPRSVSTARGGDYIPYQMNFADLNHAVVNGSTIPLVPWDAYQGMFWCWDFNNGTCPVILDNYRPYIINPPQLTELDPHWTTCGLFTGPIFDPPIALSTAANLGAPSNTAKPTSESKSPVSNSDSATPGNTITSGPTKTPTALPDSSPVTTTHKPASSSDTPGSGNGNTGGENGSGGGGDTDSKSPSEPQASSSPGSGGSGSSGPSESGDSSNQSGSDGTSGSSSGTGDGSSGSGSSDGQGGSSGSEGSGNDSGSGGSGATGDENNPPPITTIGTHTILPAPPATGGGSGSSDTPGDNSSSGNGGDSSADGGSPSGDEGSSTPSGSANGSGESNGSGTDSSASSNGRGVVIDGHTYTAGGSGTTIDGTSVSVGSSGLVIGASGQAPTTIAITEPAASASANGASTTLAPVLAVGSSTYTAKTTTISGTAEPYYVIGSSTLTPGGTVTASSDGSTYTIALPNPTGSKSEPGDTDPTVVVVNGKTSTLAPEVVPLTDHSAEVITLGGTTYTADSASQFIVTVSNGAVETIVPGGGTVTVDGTPVAVLPGGSTAVVGGKTYSLSAIEVTTVSAEVITLGGTKYTADSASAFVVTESNGIVVTVTPGGSTITVDGTPVAILPGGSSAVIGSRTVSLSEVPVSTASGSASPGDFTGLATSLGWPSISCMCGAAFAAIFAVGV